MFPVERIVQITELFFYLCSSVFIRGFKKYFEAFSIAGVRFVLPGGVTPFAFAAFPRAHAFAPGRAVASPPAVLFLLSEATAA
jgi:hypothetical protein